MSYTALCRFEAFDEISECSEVFWKIADPAPLSLPIFREYFTNIPPPSVPKRELYGTVRIRIVRGNFEVFRSISKIANPTPLSLLILHEYSVNIPRIFQHLPFSNASYTVLCKFESFDEISKYSEIFRKITDPAPSSLPIFRHPPFPNANYTALCEFRSPVKSFDEISKYFDVFRSIFKYLDRFVSRSIK